MVETWAQTTGRAVRLFLPPTVLEAQARAAVNGDKRGEGRLGLLAAELPLIE